MECVRVYIIYEDRQMIHTYTVYTDIQYMKSLFAKNIFFPVNHCYHVFTVFFFCFLGIITCQTKPTEVLLIGMHNNKHF